MFRACNVPLIYTVATAATAEPIDVADLRQHVRETRGDNDAVIQRSGKTARALVEARTRRQLMPATYDLYLPFFPDEIRIPLSPLLSISSITYVDANGDSQTLSTSVYTVDTDCEPGRVYLAHSQTWPVTQGIDKAVTVRFVSGYSASSDTDTARAAIPAGLIETICVKTEILYDSHPDGSPLDNCYESLIAIWRVPNAPVAVRAA